MKSCLEPSRRRFLKTGLGCLVLGWLCPLRTLLAKIPESEPRMDPALLVISTLEEKIYLRLILNLPILSCIRAAN